MVNDERTPHQRGSIKATARAGDQTPPAHSAIGALVCWFRGLAVSARQKILTPKGAKSGPRTGSRRWDPESDEGGTVTPPKTPQKGREGGKFLIIKHKNMHDLQPQTCRGCNKMQRWIPPNVVKGLDNQDNQDNGTNWIHLGRSAISKGGKVRCLCSLFLQAPRGSACAFPVF